MSDQKGIANLFEDITDEAIMGILTFHAASRTAIYHNRLARILFEIQESMPGVSDLKLDDLFPIERRGDFTLFADKILQNQGFYQDILIRRANGQTFIANVGVRHIESAGGSIILLMVQDITLQKKLQRDIQAKQIEIKAAYEELLKQNRQLRALDIAKDRFIAVTTHELRTPLSAMVASAEILKLRLYDTEEQAKEFIDIIYEQGLHLQELVNDILDMAKIHAGKMDYYIQEEDLIPLLKSVTENFTGMAENLGVTIQLRESTGPQMCYFDDMRMRQVISNVVNNAVKYNRKGGEVEIWVESKENKILVHVRDTGPGIPPDQFEAVFNEFETIGHVSAHHKGTGLGLPISRRMMEGMGGTIGLESEVGKGSDFWIEVPTTKILPDELYRPRPEQSSDLAA